MSSPVNVPAPTRHASSAQRPEGRANANAKAPAGASPFALLLRGQADEAEPVATPAPASSAETGASGTEGSEAPERRPDAARDSGPAADAPTNWLPPGWTPGQRPEAASADAGRAEGTAAVGALTEAHGGQAAAARRRAAAGQAEGAAADTDPRAGQARPGGPEGPAAEPPAAVASAEAPVAAAPPKEASAEGSLPSLGAVTETRHAPTGPAAAEAPAPAQAHLPEPPGTPGFAPALGLQLSTWLRDGIQHASLELNPADLGPIDVRIAVRDGQAEVALAADVPSTRQALAEALPQLAGALGDVGLSLSGGSVSDQGARRQNAEDAAAAAGARQTAGGGRAAHGEGVPAAPAPASARRQRGLLDLYA